ncbi:glycoside hydrolase family 5 protein [bacterium]|nr:glycoside hydrolase family 5 protein [bacterium]
MMKPLSLHPDNPHYFMFRGEPAVLITSGEHYGAVLNRAFDFIPYLDALAHSGFNLTRVFSGVYRELPGSHGIMDNTLAPATGDFLCPWASRTHGGAEMFDLSKWDPAYFSRLKDFVRAAGERGIVVEVVLFCFWYNDELWQASPMHPRNNGGATEDVPRNKVYSLDTPRLLKVQEAVTRAIVKELGGFDNVYFEISNENYSNHDGTAYLDWSNHIADVITDAERSLPDRHLIAFNAQNRFMRVKDLHPAVSIINFHYAEPAAVHLNYHLDRVVADDETGFKGQTCAPYRREAWEFMLCGGGAVSHLDYSFTAEHPDGTHVVRNETPGYGGPEWRAQLAVLKRFIESFEFVKLAPHPEVAEAGKRDGMTTWCLAEHGKQYALYCWGGGMRSTLHLGLAPGAYTLEMINPSTGSVMRREEFDHACGLKRVDTPIYTEDLAVRIKSR